MPFHRGIQTSIKALDRGSVGKNLVSISSSSIVCHCAEICESFCLAVFFWGNRNEGDVYDEYLVNVESNVL